MAHSKRNEYEAGIKWWDITDREHYINRRDFMRKAGTVAAGVGLATAAPGFVQRAFAQNGAFPGLPGSKYDTDEEQNTLKQATTYNNFWEFGAGKNDPSRHAKDFVTKPWQITIGGLLANPVTVDIEDVIKRYRDKLEQRIYRMRCVEAWSMVIPWVGFPLHELIKDYQPDSGAKYMRFETFWDPKLMRRAARSIQYPYVEGLRMDEAMNDLTLVTVGMYGDVLAESERPADQDRDALEVRLQEHQEHHQDRIRRRRAGEYLEAGAAARVRVLLQCESGAPAPALEPGHRAPHRRARPPRDAQVQRLRRVGGPDVRGDGPDRTILLSLRGRGRAYGGRETETETAQPDAGGQAGQAGRPAADHGAAGHRPAALPGRPVRRQRH